MKRLIIMLIVSWMMIAMGYAANDPMVSLFKFQSQMAAQGNVDAIMKLGEMYEQGQGTKKDLNKALEMYKKAQAKGYSEAVKAIRRIDNAKKQKLRNLEIERQKKAAREKVARQQAAREKVARQQAAREKVARQQAAREKVARQQAAREKVARQQAAREKAARQKTTRKKATRGKTTKAKAQRSLKDEQPGMGWDEEDEVSGGKPTVTKPKLSVSKVKPTVTKPKSSVTKVEPAVTKPKSTENKKEGKSFTSNPCNTPAGHFIATCRKK